MNGGGTVIRRRAELVACVSCGERMEALKLPHHIASVHLAYYAYRCVAPDCGLKWTNDGYSAMLVHRCETKHHCERKHSTRMEDALQAIFDESVAKHGGGGLSAVAAPDEDDIEVLSTNQFPAKLGKKPPFGKKMPSDRAKEIGELDDSVAMDTNMGSLAEFFDLTPEVRSQPDSPNTPSTTGPDPAKSQTIKLVKNDIPAGLFPLTAYQHWLQANFANVVVKAQKAGEDPDEKALKLWGSLRDKSHWESLATRGGGRASG